MATALIHMDPEQKRRLTQRAKLRGKSFSQEARDAIELYLDIPLETEDEIKMLAQQASESADRSIARLNEATAYIARGLKAMKKNQ